MLTLQAVTELLKKKDVTPPRLMFRLTREVTQQDIVAFQSELSINTSISRVYIYAENSPDKPDIQLPKPFLEAIIAILRKNIHITDIVFVDCVIPENEYEQIEKQLVLNNRYENELINIAVPRDAYVAFNMEVRDESFDTKLAKIEDDIRKMLADGVTQLRLGVIVREITLAELNQLIELRKKYPQIAVVFFSSSVNMQENPAQIAIAVNNLAAGLSGIQLNIIPPPEAAEAEFSFAENTLQQCIHTLNIHPGLRELTINGPIDEAVATKIGNALRDNQGLQHLSISVRDDSCLTILSDSLRENSTLLKLLLGVVSQSKQGVINICKALHAHPTLTHLNMGDIEIDENILHSVLVLLNANPSIKVLHFNVTNPFSEELFIPFCAALEKNTSLRELRLRPNPFTVHCAQALSQLLTRNRGLKVFSFDSNDIFPIQTSAAAINELLKHLPDYHVIDLTLADLQYDDNYLEVLPAFYRVVEENQRLVKFVFGFAQSHVFSDEIKSTIQSKVKALLESNKGSKFEDIEIRPVLLPGLFDDLCRKTQANRQNHDTVILLKAIEKVLMHVSFSEYEKSELEKQAIDLFMLVKDSYNNFIRFNPDQELIKIAQGHHILELINSVYVLLANIGLRRDDLCIAYEYLHKAADFPAACIQLVEILFPDKKYLSFDLTKQQWQQYLLLLLLMTDLESGIAVSFTKKILHALQTGKDENYTGSFVDLIGAERPLSYAILIKMVENIIIRCKDPKFVAPANFNMALIDQLQAVLNDKSISYIERFNLLRTHPEVKAELQKRYGTYSVVCFDKIILSKGQKIIYDVSVGWDQAYQAYHQAKQLVLAVDKSHVAENDFAELAAIKRKFKECYDILYLTEETRASAQNNEVFRNRLISLSTNVPIISAFLGTLFLQLHDTVNASKYYLQAATQGNFSQIKILRTAAKKGEAWAIELLNQKPFIRQYPHMWLFLGNCYMRRGDTDQALVYYQKTKPMTPEGFSLMGDCYIKRNEIKLAIDCYRQADPLNNEEACHALEVIADEYRDVHVILILADIYRRKTQYLPDDKATLMSALRYNFKAGKANSDEANHFLAVILTNQHITPQLYAIALQLEENPADLELAKQLYVIAQRTHPIARLELMRLNHPPHMTIKEKVFDDNAQTYCEKIRSYFESFSESNSFDIMPSSHSDNRDVATTICRHLTAHPTLSPQEILTWLREKAINNNQRIDGEFARMFCCAIVQLKLWSAKIAEHKLEISPLRPPARA